MGFHSGRLGPTCGGKRGGAGNAVFGDELAAINIQGWPGGDRYIKRGREGRSEDGERHVLR